MDFHQLRLFVAVAEELHFGRAAARVGMAQPPFSQQIRRLEQQLGVRLLERTSRRVSLTPGGMHLLGEARDLLARRERIADGTRRAGDEVGVALRLGFAASSALGLLPGIVRGLRAASPGISLHLDDRGDIDVAAALRTGDLDVAIVRGPFAATGVTTEIALREPFVAVVPFDHAFEAVGDRAGGLGRRTIRVVPETVGPRPSRRRGRHVRRRGVLAAGRSRSRRLGIGRRARRRRHGRDDRP